MNEQCENTVIILSMELEHQLSFESILFNFLFTVNLFNLPEIQKITDYCSTLKIEKTDSFFEIYLKYKVIIQILQVIC